MWYKADWICMILHICFKANAYIILWLHYDCKVNLVTCSYAIVLCVRWIALRFINILTWMYWCILILLIIDLHLPAHLRKIYYRFAETARHVYIRFTIDLDQNYNQFVIDSQHIKNIVITYLQYHEFSMDLLWRYCNLTMDSLRIYIAFTMYLLMIY